MKTQIFLSLITITVLFQFSSCRMDDSNKQPCVTFNFNELLDTTVLFSRNNPGRWSSTKLAFHPDSTFDYLKASGGCLPPWQSTTYSGKVQFFNDGKQIMLLPDSVLTRIYYPVPLANKEGLKYDYKDVVIDSFSCRYELCQITIPLEENEFWIIPWQGIEYLIPNGRLDEFITFSQDHFGSQIFSDFLVNYKKDSSTLENVSDLKSYLNEEHLEHLFISKKISSQITKIDSLWVVDEKYEWIESNQVYHLNSGFNDSIFRKFHFVGKNSNCLLKVVRTYPEKAVAIRLSNQKCQIGEKVVLKEWDPYEKLDKSDL